MKKLEKNVITYCDPSTGISDTRFQKLSYKMPSMLIED